MIAFITSKGTLDKANSSVRKYIAQRAELLGAVRLPSNTFQKIANTKVTTDILFFRKYEKQKVNEPEWIHVGMTEQGVPINEYYLHHPDHMLGTMVFDKSMYGNEKGTSCINDNPDFNLIGVLQQKLKEITEQQIPISTQPITEHHTEEYQQIEHPEVLPANPGIKNYTYTIVDNVLYYRENDEMFLQKFDGKTEKRIKGMCAIRNQVMKVIELQSQEYIEIEFQQELAKLNQVYDEFIKNNGYLSDRVNKRAFRDDSDLPLILSLENKKKNRYEKAAIFCKPTIQPKTEPSINTAKDALAVSLYRRGKLDLKYMAEIYPHSVDDIITELGDRIFFDPSYLISGTMDNLSGYVTAEEYLSGNVKEKLKLAELKVEDYPELQKNVTALKAVQPKRLNISDIHFEIGTSWIPLEYIRNFCYKTFHIPSYQQENGYDTKNRIYFHYDKHTTRYTIYNKPLGSCIETTSVYGTERKNAFYLVEDCLNLKQTEVTDRITTLNAKGEEQEKQVLNPKETQLARAKQEKIQQEFVSWILKDTKKVQRLEDIYNDNYNVYVPRNYDGSGLVIDGMAKDIELRPHQKNAAMRVLLGGNTLLAHEVGAGKTFTMAAGAMLLKQTGIATKSLFVVPNHLTEQWGKDFLKLFPTANILVATKKDFQKENRKKFTNRIAMGDYDAVIMSYTQFERIPMSNEYKAKLIQEEIDDIVETLRSASEDRQNHYSIKRLEAQKISLQTNLKKMMESGNKDDTLTFEQLGIDRLFIDEFDYYKNCYVYTKIQNVAGLGVTRAEKSFDLLTKIRYLNEKTNYQAVVGATGTPISNSMSEVYILLRYFIPNVLQQLDMSQFDFWASIFTKVESILEIAPEGTGYRMRNRFCKFYNLPELMQIFSLFVDIKLIEDLKIPRPKIHTGKPEVISTKPTEFVKQYISELAERSERIRGGSVDPSKDNMLLITTQGRAIAIDPRILFPDMEVGRESKIYAVCDNVKKLYDQYNEDKAFQIVFLDSGIKMYEMMKQDLVEQGIPSNEIAFIHDAKTGIQKADLFEKCRNGDIRVLFGSTAKCGAGTNVQDRLIAVHHVDEPWRPRDLTQRNGRGQRQGNQYDEIYVYYYVTKGTFDAYLFQTLEQKQRFISQIMTNQSPARSCDDLDEMVLNYAEVKSCATGDTKIKDQMELQNEVKKLQLERAAYLTERKRLQEMIQSAPEQIERLKNNIAKIEQDIETVQQNQQDDFKITLDGKQYDKRPIAAELLSILVSNSPTGQITPIGEYRGLQIAVDKASGFYPQFLLKGVFSYEIECGESNLGNITKIEHLPTKLQGKLQNMQMDLAMKGEQLKQAKKNVDRPFEKEGLLQEKAEKLAKIEYEISIEVTQDIHLENETQPDKQPILAGGREYEEYEMEN